MECALQKYGMKIILDRIEAKLFGTKSKLMHVEGLSTK